MALTRPIWRKQALNNRGLLRLFRRLLQSLPPDSANQVRTSLIRAQAGWHRLTFKAPPEPTDGWPLILQISVVKSGTHLLDQILTGFSHVSPFSPRALYLQAYDHQAGVPYDVGRVAHALSKYHPLEVVKCHISSDPVLVRSVDTRNFLTYFLYRDPRDVIVALAYRGFLEAPPEAKSRFYSLPMEERIRHLIVGVDFGRFCFSGINALYYRLLGWSDYPFVLSLRYEDLIHHRQDALQQIVDHFLHRIDTLPFSREQIIRALEANIDPKRSPTFRRGATGDWKTHFTTEHKKLFKEHTGDLLIQLGYEKDTNW